MLSLESIPFSKCPKDLTSSFDAHCNLHSLIIVKDLLVTTLGTCHCEIMNKSENCGQQPDLFLTDKYPQHRLMSCQISVSSPNNILTIKAIQKVPHTRRDFEKT